MRSPPKRILFVTDLWFSHPNGVATVVYHLQKELEKQGHTVDVMEPGQFFTVPFPLYPEWRIPFFARGGVRRRIARGRYDHIHVETEAVLGFLARRACMKLGIPFTTSMHGQMHLYAKDWVGEWAEHLVKRLVVRFHAPSRATLVSTVALKRQAEAMGIAPVHVRPFGVSERFFARGACPTTFEHPVFLYMGRVSSEKSIDEFLAADLAGTKLVVGDGPDRKRLATRFPHAKFVGAKTGQELVDWCSCADVMVMPSRTETFGLSMVECLALGIPVAAHDVTGPREIVVNGVNGYLDEDLVRAAKRCLALPHEACRDSVRKFTWGESASAFLSILESTSATGEDRTSG